MNSVNPKLLLVIVALPALAVSVPKAWPNDVVPKLSLVMVADPAEARSTKSSWAAF